MLKCLPGARVSGDGTLHASAQQDSGIGDSGVLDLLVLSAAVADSASAPALVVAGAALGSGCETTSRIRFYCSVFFLALYGNQIKQ